MVITEKTYLPEFEELVHTEIPFSGNILRAGALQLGKYCEEKNDEFMLCRYELGPARCIKEGKDVTDCTLQFFGMLKKSCYHELDRYAYCLDHSSADLAVQPCRKTQAAFDKCVLDNLGIRRPQTGYYSHARIYNSKVRPPPPPAKPQIFSDTPISPDSPDFPAKESAKYGYRDWGLNY